MSLQMKRARTDDCIGDLRFDQYAGGELDAAAQAQVSSHLALCERCRERQALLAREREHFEHADLSNPEWLQKRRPKVSRGMLGLLAAAACLLLTLQLRAPVETLRTKGDPFIGFYVKRGDEVRRGSIEEALHPGDRLRFTYTAASAQYLAILSVDGAAQASVYYPADAHAARIEAGTDVLLPSSVELDETLGEETIAAVFCAEPFEIAPLRATVAALPARAGCSSHTLQVHKRCGSCLRCCCSRASPRRSSYMRAWSGSR
jgi:anti-sigma factor RsiW